MTMKVNPRVFFDIEVGGLPMGRVIFELYSDICPKTCENFRALCSGEMGLGQTTGKPLHFKGIVFHRVVKNFMIQGGDFSVGNGTGGESIYGGTFPDENFSIMHSKPFLLSMANRGKDTNGSQFFITTQPAPHLDNVHVVFGEVVSGHEVVSHIEGLPVDRMSRPLQDAKVVSCGELILKMKSKAKKRNKVTASSDTESNSSTERTKKRKKNKKSKKKSKYEEGEVDDSHDDGTGNVHPLVSVTKIDPDEIPEIPANKFLYRAGPTNNSNQKEYRQRFIRDRMRNQRKTGRVFKGRGIFRYHTPSRSRSRSVTPPHWKQAQNRTIKLHELKRIRRDGNSKGRDPDKPRKFVENPNGDDETVQQPNDENNSVPELNKSKVNHYGSDKEKEHKNRDNNPRNSEKGSNNQSRIDYKRRDRRSPHRDSYRSFGSRYGGRDIRDYNRRGRSRSRDGRRSKDRSDRRRSYDRRPRRDYSPRRSSYKSKYDKRENEHKSPERPSNTEAHEIKPEVTENIIADINDPSVEVNLNLHSSSINSQQPEDK